MISAGNPGRKLPKNIPAALVYEVLDGKPVYYKGYREVLEQKKTIEEIMGSSNLQATITEYILMVLYRNLDLATFRILTNEVGLHLEKKNNLSGDILLYEKSVLPVTSADRRYIPIAPKIHIEVDIDADTEDFVSGESYVYAKTQKLLDFGTEKVIWVLSETRKVLLAQPDRDWQVIDWHKPVEVLEGTTIAVGAYLKEAGLEWA